MTIIMFWGIYRKALRLKVLIFTIDVILTAHEPAIV